VIKVSGKIELYNIIILERAPPPAAAAAAKKPSHFLFFSTSGTVYNYDFSEENSFPSELVSAV
jgi:hypothetical protein